MPALLDLTPRTRKPPVAAVLNVGHGLTQGLVDRWLVNAGAGATAPSLTRKYPGTIANPTNSTSQWRPGIDGVGWYIGPVSVGDTSYFTQANLGAPGTVSYELIWVMPASAVNVGLLNTTNGIRTDGTHERALYTEGTGGLTAYIYDGGTKKASTAGNLNAGQRYHAVFTVDGTNLTLYLDGIQVAQTAAGNAYTAYTTPTFYAGVSTTDTGSQFMTGDILIQAVGMWSRALSAREVLTLYRSPWDMAVVPGRILTRLSPPAGGAVAATTVQRRTSVATGARVGSRQAS